MAFNKAPSQSTYQTKDVKFLFALDNRDQAGTKDTIALNGFFDIIKDKSADDKEYIFQKRDGTTLYPYAIASDTVRGIHYWKDQDKLFIAYNNKIAIVTASTGVLSTTVTPFSTTSGTVAFTEFYYDTGSVKVVAGDGTTLITIDSANTVVTGADPDQPASFLPYLVFLDGYIFMVKSGTSDIYNSELNDPLAFTSGDFITAEMQPDTLAGLAKLNNYIVALGSGGIEYFFDAANASGSPLQRNDTPVKQVGFLGGLAYWGNKLLFVGKTATTSPEVFMLEDFKIDSLENPSLRRYIQPYTSFQGAVISQGGRDFYTITVGTITYWMDLETRLWTRGAFKSDTTFPITFATNINVTGKGNVSVFSLSTGTSLFYFDPSVYRDDTTNFTVQVTTEKYNFDTMHYKTMSRVVVYGDKSTGSLSVSYTDDDYQNFSTARLVSMATSKPMLHRFGLFTSRAFKVTYTDNSPIRLHHLEVDFNILKM